MKKNNNIQILRAVFIILIIIYHYTFRFLEIYNISFPPASIAKNFGKMGVAGFAIISGFLLYKENEKITSILKYIFFKIKRIWPSYFICITFIYISLVLFGLPQREVNLIDYILNVFFINGFIGTKYVDGAHWYITYLIVLYFWMAIYKKYISNKKHGEYIFILFLIIKVIIKVLVKMKYIPSTVLVLIMSECIEYFIIGYLLNRYKNNYKDRTFIIIYASCLALITIDNNFTLLLFTIIISYIFIRLIDKKYDFIDNNKSIKYLGNISFVVYLIHQNIGYQIILLLYNIVDTYSILFAFIASAFTILLSILIYELFEKKFINTLRKKQNA